MTDPIHYQDEEGWPVCGSLIKLHMTARPRRVTCEKCKRTKAFKTMMEAP